MNWPKPPRLLTSRMRPLPLHCGQVSRPVPGAAPLPAHVSQATSALTSTSRCAPKAASRSSSSTVASTSSPRGAGAVPLAPQAAPPASRSTRVEHAAAAEEDVEEIGEAELVEVGHRPALETVEAVAVVGGARVGVAQHLVGLGRFLELGLGLGVFGVDVGVVLARQLAKRLLDLGRVGVAVDAEHVVVVALHRAYQISSK